VARARLSGAEERLRLRPRAVRESGPHARISRSATRCGIGRLALSPVVDIAPHGYTADNRGFECPIPWNERNLPESIFNGTGDSADFRYGPAGERYSQVAYAAIPGNEETITTMYVGALFEQIDKDTTSLTEYRHYVMAGGARVAIHTEWSNANTRDEYLFQDHLGSVTAITQTSGAIVERFSYDPWGKRRNPATWDAAGTYLPTMLDHISRGFTDHEHLDRLGLIHMNGRVFDPQIGRFLSADSFMQFPQSTQGFDRYAYAANNPLRYTDPSGHDLFVVGALFALAGGWTIEQTAIAIFVVGFLETGSLAGAIQNTLFFSVGAGFGQALGLGQLGFADPGKLLGASAVMGFMGGITAQAYGGKFGEGFLSAFAATVAMPWTRTASGFGEGIFRSAIIGGTAGEIGGGKFANGAAYAAFSYAVAAGAEASRDQSNRVEADVTSDFLEGRDIQRALRRDGVADALNVEVAAEYVEIIYREGFEGYPVSDGVFPEIVYIHERGPNDVGAMHRATFGPAGSDIVGDRITLYAGSARSVESAVKIILHEFGHHTPEAVARTIGNIGRIRNPANTPRLENIADRYSRDVYRHVTGK